MGARPQQGQQTRTELRLSRGQQGHRLLLPERDGEREALAQRHHPRLHHRRHVAHSLEPADNEPRRTRPHLHREHPPLRRCAARRCRARHSVIQIHHHPGEGHHYNRLRQGQQEPALRPRMGRQRRPHHMARPEALADNRHRRHEVVHLHRQQAVGRLLVQHGALAGQRGNQVGRRVGHQLRRVL